MKKDDIAKIKSEILKEIEQIKVADLPKDIKIPMPEQKEIKIEPNTFGLSPELLKIRDDFVKNFYLYNAYNPILHKKMGFFRRIKYKWWLRHHPTTTYQIRMELKNGKHTTFLVNGDDKGFFYRAGRYIYDADFIYFDINAGKNGLGLWTYDYYEGYPAPFKRQFPINDVLAVIKSNKSPEDIKQIEYATNPQRLQEFENSTIIEQILKGGELLDMLKRMQLLLFIALGGLLVVGVLVYWAKGDVLKAIEALRVGLEAFVNSFK